MRFLAKRSVRESMLLGRATSVESMCRSSSNQSVAHEPRTAWQRWCASGKACGRTVVGDCKLVLNINDVRREGRDRCRHLMTSVGSTVGWSVLLSAVVVAAAAHASAAGIQFVDGSQHPNHHVDGFVLRAAYVFVHGSHAGPRRLQRRNLRFDDHPHLLHSRRGLPEFSADRNNKDRVIALAKLNMLAYDLSSRDDYQTTALTYSKGIMESIFSDPDASSIFGQGISTYAEEVEATRAFYEAIQKELADALSAGATSKHIYRPHETQINKDGFIDSSSVGVAALEFQRGSVKVLVFRGTVGAGDETNIINWLHDWILERMSARMKEIWVDEAGLEWDDTMQKRSQEGELTSSNVICAYNYMYSTPSQKLAASSNVSLTPEQAASTGYWEITKAITSKTYEEAKVAGDELIISGHSQGGTRAALASMFLHKSKGLRLQTVTFASTGPQCFARQLYSNSNMLADVDPFQQHPQITEYVVSFDKPVRLRS